MKFIPLIPWGYPDSKGTCFVCGKRTKVRFLQALIPELSKIRLQDLFRFNGLYLPESNLLHESYEVRMAAVNIDACKAHLARLYLLEQITAESKEINKKILARVTPPNQISIAAGISDLSELLYRGGAISKKELKAFRSLLDRLFVEEDYAHLM
jgi:hypothetical protein